MIQKIKTSFFITARLKSTRLPKKILLKVLGKPLIVHMLDRIKHATCIDKIVICTSTNPQDDPLEEIAAQEHVFCYRGSEEDVLARLLEAAQRHDLKHFANITADCPMMDPKLIDQAVMKYQNSDADLLMYDDSNNDIPFGCYMIKVTALEKVCQKKNETDTEDWNKHFTSNPDLKIRSIDVEEKYRHKTLKTSLDYPEDYEVVNRIDAELNKRNQFGHLEEIIQILKNHPEIVELNSKYYFGIGWR